MLLTELSIKIKKLVLVKREKLELPVMELVMPLVVKSLVNAILVMKELIVLKRQMLLLLLLDYYQYSLV